MKLIGTYHVEKGVAGNEPAPLVFKAVKERRNPLSVRPIQDRGKGF